MKNFLKIFVFLEILLFAYIFNSSIYNIYEKNNIAADNLSGYMVEETRQGTKITKKQEDKNGYNRNT